MHVPRALVVLGMLAIAVVGFVFVFLMLAAVRFLFAFAELFGGLLLIGLVAFFIWMLFFKGESREADG